MKKLLMLLALLFTFIAVGYAGIPVNEDFNTGNIQKTTVSDSAWNLVTGSTAQTSDNSGNKFNTRAYQIAVYDSAYNVLDFYYAYSASPSTWFPWRASLWGPLQTNQLPPAAGFYIYLTITSGTATAYIDLKY